MKGINMRNISESEFNIKYKLYKDTIYNIAYTYFKNISDSEDIVQEVFIKYLNSEKVFKNLDNEKYFLIRVTINECKNQLKSSWKKKVLVDDESILNVSDDTEKEKYFNIVTSLEPKYKEVIVLYYYENLKINDIAQILKISTSNVKKRLERGRLKIKEAISDERL